MKLKKVTLQGDPVPQPLPDTWTITRNQQFVGAECGLGFAGNPDTLLFDDVPCNYALHFLCEGLGSFTSLS